jgi:foldase protein PrsA
VRTARVSQRAIALALVALLAIAVGAYAATRGLGQDDVPAGAVAKVKDTVISQEQFERALEQAAAQQGIKEVPQPGDPQYELLKQSAMGSVLDAAWIQNEAEERGVEVSERQVEQQLKQVKEQNFDGSEKKFQKFLKRSKFTPEEVDQRVQLQVLSQLIQQQVASDAPPITNAELEDYYDANVDRFEQPEQRTVRLVLNKSQAKVDQALSALQSDDSGKSWKKVAKQYSTDSQSKKQGGLRENLTPGLVEEPLNEEIFKAPENELEGPVKTELGYYVFEVVKSTPKRQVTLAEATPQLRQQLSQQQQQTAFQDFVADYRDLWTSLTVCAPEFVIDRCSNFDTPPQRQPGAPPVVSTKPATPGSIQLFTTPAGLAQGPFPPPEPAGGAPGGIPGLPGGVPGQPGGAAPGGAAPGGTAPPGAAP